MKKIIFFTILILNFAENFAQSPEYGDLKYWAAHPNKWDFADSLPSDLRNESKKIHAKKANVFFLYPTSYTEKGGWEKRTNADINDAELNRGTEERSILFQASCFNDNTNLYAPFYRQAHIDAFYQPSGGKALDTAYNDVRNAFLYFLKTADTSLPLIIASHSQGTVHAGRIIKEFIESKPLQAKLVVAYLIGMPVSKTYFTTLKPCGNENETGCFVSWRTYLKGSEGEAYLKKELPNSIVVTNPLTWTMSTEMVSRKKNNGSVLLKFNTVVKNVSGAQINGNILWITKPKFKFSFLVKNKMTNYHIADINLFYINIRENQRNRINQWYAQLK